MTGPGAAAAQCPHCALPMRTVQAHARSGYAILLDQCAACGGIWCDRWELFSLTAEDAARIDPVDEARLASPVAPPQHAGRCPRCTTPLRAFHDPLLPPDARIERCPVCDGMWLNRGELARAKRRTPPTRTPSPALLAALTGAVGATSQWSTVANLDAATYAAEDETPPDAGELATLARSAGPWIVLRALLRLLLRI
jgi:Zn-finger nucleic acid-binding protein